MAVSGTINVSLSAIDTYTTDGIDAEKKLSLSSAVALTDIAVTLLTGTCGTAGVQFNVADIDYRGADGELVSIDGTAYLLENRTRIAFSAEPAAELNWDTILRLRMTSRDREVAISSFPMNNGILPTGAPYLQVKTIASLGNPNPTASFSVAFLQKQ